MSKTQLTCKYRQQVKASIPAFKPVGHFKAGDITGSAEVGTAMISADVYMKEDGQFISLTGNGSKNLTKLLQELINTK